MKNRLTFYIILLHGLFLGIATASAKSPSVNIDTELSANQKAVRVVEAVVTAKNGEKPNSQVTTETFSTKTSALSPKNINIPEKQRLAPGQVWVLNQNKHPQPQPFIWVVQDLKKAGQQPFLQVAKPAEKPKPSKTPTPKDDLEPFDEVIKDTQKSGGLFTLYRNKEKNKIYLEIKPEQLNKNYLATATLESGIGERGIYSGMPLQDFLFYFQRVDDKLNFVIRNVNFRTREGDPQVRSLARSFSDSVLYSISLKSIHPERKTLLIDLGDLLLTDLGGLSASLGVPGTTDQSYFGTAKAFPQNLEIESVLNFSGGSQSEIASFASLADNRGYTLRVHYS
ncbi:MAG: DUF5117 domain-containing protein, partial [Nostoc sp. C3-bin3]|nr:DUF5117 domain-containing protein [Nostoc sp. C3-bin3]